MAKQYNYNAQCILSYAILFCKYPYTSIRFPINNSLNIIILFVVKVIEKAISRLPKIRIIHSTLLLRINKFSMTKYQCNYYLKCIFITTNTADNHICEIQTICHQLPGTEITNQLFYNVNLCFLSYVLILCKTFDKQHISSRISMYKSFLCILKGELLFHSKTKKLPFIFSFRIFIQILLCMQYKRK